MFELESSSRCRLVAALLVVALAGACRPGSDAPLSGVLITLDTTRADALGCYEGPGARTPRLDAFAQECVQYEAAHTVTPLTLPSHASMLTGLYPPRHTVHTNALSALPASARTLAEYARDADYETAAFLSAVVLDPPFGLNQGFDVYDTPRGTAALSTSHMVERSDAEVTRAATAWLRERDDERPFFLWVHYFDPHAPYEPAPAFRPARGDDRANYLGEVAAMDAAFGEFIDVLDEEHGLDDTLVVVVSDHGEALGAHGEPTHSVLVYQELLAIPFMIRFPDGARGGEQVGEIVSVVDVFPTMLEGLGLGAPGNVDGISLMNATLPPDRGVYFESHEGYLNYGFSPLVGWIDAEGKYIHGTGPEFYDLAADRGEVNNLYPEQQPATERYRRAIEELATKPVLEKNSESLFDTGLRSDIQKLGYAAVASVSAEIPRLLEPTGFPDARDRMDELARFYTAILSYNGAKRRGNAAAINEALMFLEQLADANPENLAANDALGNLFYQEGRAEDAIDRLQNLPDRGRDRATVQDILGHSYERLGAPEQALPHFRRALELKPGDAHQLEDMIRILLSLQRSEEARTYLDLLNRRG